MYPIANDWSWSTSDVAVLRRAGRRADIECTMRWGVGERSEKIPRGGGAAGGLISTKAPKRHTTNNTYHLITSRSTDGRAGEVERGRHASAADPSQDRLLMCRFGRLGVRITSGFSGHTCTAALQGIARHHRGIGRPTTNQHRAVLS